MKACFVAGNKNDVELLVEEKVDSLLISFAYCKKGLPESLIKAGEKRFVMLDSGAFTNKSKPGTVSIEAYMEFLDHYKKYVDEYVTFDDINNRAKTVSNYLLLKEKGYNPLYVDHLWSSWIPVLEKFYKEKKLCWAGIDNYWPDVQIKKMNKRFDKALAKPKSYLHVLAVGQRLRKFLPWMEVMDSFDSTTWNTGGKFGKWCLYHPATEDFPFPRFRQHAPPWAGKKPPKEVYEAFEKEKLSGYKMNDRTRMTIRQLKKYYDAIEKFHSEHKKKGHEWLHEVAMRKDEVGPEQEYPLQVQVATSLRDMIKKASAVSPGTFLPQPKPTRPAYAFQRQDLKNFLGLYEANKEKWLPAYFQKKFDGVRIQAHRKDGVVKLFTEQDQDVTDRLPEIVKELTSLKPSIDFVFDSEVEAWKGQQHLPREVLAGKLSSKGEPDDEGCVLNVFDVMFSEKDIHDEPLSERQKSLDNFSFAQSTNGAPKSGLNKVPSIIVKTVEEAERVVVKVRELPGSEGVVAKQVDSKYPLELVTHDAWVKFHNTVEIYGVVVGRTLIKGSSKTWTYHFGVLVGDSKAKESFTEKDRELIKVGDTFNSSIDLQNGDGILVEAETVNFEKHSDGVVLTAWVPRVIATYDGKVDDIKAVVARAKNELVLQEKEIDDKGEVEYVPTRVRKQNDPYLEIPPESRKYPYIVHQHWRGKGVHSDFRIGFKLEKLLLGWTLNTSIAGAIKEAVTTLSQARQMAREEMDNYSKINWRTGEWALRDKRGVTKPVRTSILAERKAPEPWAWIEVEGATKTTEEGGPPPVGGTRNFPGVFQIVDRGDLEFGAQKPWFHEYFVQGDGMNYRVLFRQLKLGAEVLPPSEGEGETLGGGSWLFMRPDDQTPYVLDKDAADKGWMPPAGFSALPEAIRNQIPSQYRYWKMSSQTKAKMTRDYLIDAIRDKEVEIDFEAPYKKGVQKASMTDADFVFQEQLWRGPKTVRSGPSNRRYFVRLDIGKPELLVLSFDRDPFGGDQVTMNLENDPHKDSLKFEGDVSPGHYLNPTKNTPSTINILDKGKAEVMSLEKDFLKVQLHGSKSGKGLFVATFNPGGGEWLWEKSQAAPEAKEKSMDYNSSIKFGMPIAKVDQEKQLVTGIVLEPDTVDAQGDTIDREAIERAAHNFLAKYNRETEMGLLHQVFGEIGVEMVESYLCPIDLEIGGQSVKEGTWVMTVRVKDDKLWKKIKNKEITGFSIGGVAAVV